MIINNKKRKVDRLLFPGYGLNKPIRQYTEAAQLVGAVFENISAKLVQGVLQQTDASVDLCPDLVHDNFWVEVKATQRRHYFKVSVPQLENYSTANSNPGELQKPREVRYHLWTYTQQHLCAEFGTVGSIVNAVCKSVTTLCVFHISVMTSLRRTCRYGCRERSYPSWKNEAGNVWHVLQVTHAFIDAMRNEPENALRMIDAPGRYEIRRWRARPQRIKYQDVPFWTCGFDVIEVVRPAKVQKEIEVDVPVLEDVPI